MRKWIKVFCSTLCVVSISVPMTALATIPEEALDILDEQLEQAAEKDLDGNDYHLAFLTGDFGLQAGNRVADQPVDTMLLFISGPDGKIVKDAQVINTIINPAGIQKMSRARPYKRGYVVALDALPVGRYRLETEIAIAGRYLTDELFFFKA